MYKIILSTLIMSCFILSCTQKNKSAETQTPTPADPVTGELYLLIGTYTSDKGSKGIYVYRFDESSGKADSVSAIETTNPSYLTLSPDEKFVYAVSENDRAESSVSSFSFDKKTGDLALLNTQSTEGSAPCYIEIDPSGKNVVTANYGGGNISVFQVKDDGELTSLTQKFQFTGTGNDPQRQAAPHLHSVRFSPDGKFLFATDLGLDKIYRYDAVNSVFEGQPTLRESSLKSFDLPAQTGPRHFDFHPSGKYFYLLGELSGQVLVFDYDEGILTQTQTIAADTVGARGSADIHLSPDGNFLYASNRLQADGIAIFSVNSENGKLTKTGYQPTETHPRNFAITPDGNFLLVACRDSNKIQVFKRNPETGLLTDIHQDILLDKPVCVKFAKK